MYHFRTEHQEETMIVYGLTPFEDLKNHWIDKTASKLRYMNLLEPVNYFRPKEQITREQFAKLIVKLFGFNTDYQGTNTHIGDMSDTGENYKSVLALLDNDILNLDKEGNFYPKKPMSKAEAVTAMIRACKLRLIPESVDQKTWPYQDVSPNHWVFPYLVTALKNNIVSEIGRAHV